MGISRLLSCHISWKYGPDYAILECRMEFYRNFRHSAYPDCIRPIFRAYKMCIRDSRNAEEIEADHHQSRVLREEGRRKQAVDGQLGRAAHKGGEQDGHFAVALRGQGAAGHDAGDGAAEADEHWHDAAPREADAAEKLIRCV